MKHLDSNKTGKILLKILLLIGVIVILLITAFYSSLYFWAREINQSFTNEKKQPQKYDFQLEKYKKYYK